MPRLVWLLLIVAGLSSPPRAEALGIIDFEGLSDGTALGAQFAGVGFSNAIVLGSGLSLNEFEFPPHSGANVASDDGGAIQIVFSAPVSQVSAFFTYAVPLTLTAFDAGGNTVATAVSLFSSNLALTGAAGSSANEFILLSVPLGISRVVIAGDTQGASFVLDDLAITAVPEPAGLALVLPGLLLLGFAVRARRQQERQQERQP